MTRRPTHSPAPSAAPTGGSGGRLLVGALLLAALAALPSCAVEGVRVESPAEVPSAFSATGEAPLPEQWWTAFDDATLSGLIEEALAGNFTIRQAWDRLDQARAVAARSGAALWPALDGMVDASRTAVKTEPAPQINVNEHTLGLAANYEVDLWGRVRSTRDAARLDVYATAEDVQSAAITVAAQIAATWYQLVEARGQLRLLDEQNRTNENYLTVMTLRFGQGQVQAADVLQQQELVEQTRGQRVLVTSAITVLEHQLAVLLGRAPGGLDATVPEQLPTVPPLPQTGLPAALVRRRPDVRAVEYRVQAADRRVSAAVADQFPRLSLTAATETSAERVRSLFDNWLATLAANVAAPLFDAGLRRAEVKRVRAAVSESLNAYGQAVLTSLQEVENALVQEARQAEYVGSLGRQLALSREATARTRDSYSTTGQNFIRYLTTLLQYQRLERTHLTAQRDLVLFRIDLYRALAGEWPMEQPSPATVAGPRRPVPPPAVEARESRASAPIPNAKESE